MLEHFYISAMVIPDSYELDYCDATVYLNCAVPMDPVPARAFINKCTWNYEVHCYDLLMLEEKAIKHWNEKHANSD